MLEALLVERGARQPFEPHGVPPTDDPNRVDLRDLLTYTIDPDTAKDFDDALSFRREADGIRAWVHIADVSWFVSAGTPLDRGAARRALSTYVPGTVAPMLPHELADELCSLRPHQDRLCVTVEIPPVGEPLFYRSTIRSDARLTYGQAERREAPAGDRRRAGAERGGRAAAAGRAVRARGAAGGDARGRVPLRRQGRGRRGVARVGAARARARRGADDPRQRARWCVPLVPQSRGAVSRARAARPDGGRASAREAREPEGADAARAEAACAAAGGRACRRDLEARRGLRRAFGARTLGVPVARAALAQAGALRPAEPRPLRAREHRVLPLHLADPPLPRPRRAPRAAARARPVGRARAEEPADARRAHVGARARSREDRVPRRRHLPRVAPRAPALRARLGGEVGGRDRGRDRLRPLHPLRGGLRGLPARAAPAGRVLRDEHAGDGARRPPDAPHATASATRSRCASSRSPATRARSSWPSPRSGGARVPTASALRAS